MTSANPVTATAISTSLIQMHVTAKLVFVRNVLKIPMETIANGVNHGFMVMLSNKLARSANAIDKVIYLFKANLLTVLFLILFIYFFSLVNQLGTEECDHNTGQCLCLPGVEGELCDKCQADHWGFSIGEPVNIFF